MVVSAIPQAYLCTLTCIRVSEVDILHEDPAALLALPREGFQDTGIKVRQCRHPLPRSIKITQLISRSYFSTYFQVKKKSNAINLHIIKKLNMASILGKQVFSPVLRRSTKICSKVLGVAPAKTSPVTLNPDSSIEYTQKRHYEGITDIDPTIRGIELLRDPRTNKVSVLGTMI